MTAFVSPERARTASLTGGIGFLMIAIAVVMMVIAAPMVRHGAQSPAKNPPKPSAVQLMMDPCHRLTSRNGQTKVHACLAGPWAKEYASAL
jgi:hypothetical protein